MMDTKPCPYCGEIIKETAVKCRFCGEWLNKGRFTSPSTDHFSLVKMALASRYELIEEIGRGGMALVYKAVQKNLDRLTALKILSTQALLDAEFLERFHREARTAAKLQHPNIVMIYDEGIENNVHFIAMEYLEGFDLHNIIKKNGRVTPEETVSIIIPIAKALDYAHNNNIIHRDIKSANIFITNKNRPVLTDFGIAHAAVGTQLTMSGTVLGTPEFMSPEQADGKVIDTRSDIYSLGIVMYHALTGRLPYEGGNPLTLIYKLINEPHTPINSIRSLPEWLEKAVEACLIKDPVKRIQTAQELADLLSNKKVTDRTGKASYQTIKVSKDSVDNFYQDERNKFESKLKPAPDDKHKEAVPNKLNLSGRKENSAINRVILFSIFILIAIIGVVYFNSGNEELNNIDENLNTQQENLQPEIVSPPKYSNENPVNNSNSVTNENKTKTATELIKDEKKETITEQQISAPSVLNLSTEAARLTLKSFGLKVGTVSKMPAGSEKSGIVFKQIPAAGTKINKGSSINLIVGE